ncbi:site-2 protease family protein [Patescibacteria group bacterium]|nr:site-2 protease family protein [Patescibacteria group bacterium]MCG2694644.1 site-2 protease family protein [Candidatus Parcubacteria bacterium]
MTIILFIVVLAILIIVHELGHFIFAKKTGMRVDEFGIGFPPRLFAFKKGETEYSLNLIPLGGFVKILGETPDDESISGHDSQRSMVNKPKWAQALVISAGVLFNIIFAWVLISIGFMVGLPTSVSQFNPEDIKEKNIVIVSVVENSPAFKAGLEAGDEPLFMTVKNDSIQNFSETEMQDFIFKHGGEEITILYKKLLAEKNEQGESEIFTAFVTPIGGIIEDQSAIGIISDTVGVVQLNPFESVWEGLKLVINLIISTAVGLSLFVYGLIKGTGDLSQIAGPVGIVGMVGDAANFGFIYLLSFTALISVNLAVINFIPFPALDGGRLLFIAIEAVSRRNIKPAIANALNLIGFVLLIGLMVVVTYSDILKLF